MQSTRLIGLVVADITNPFFAELVRRIGSSANGLGYSTLLCEADHNPEKELSALQLLAAAELVDPRHQLAPLLVGREQLLEGLGCSGALVRDGRSKGLRIGPRGSEVDQPFVR